MRTLNQTLVINGESESTKVCSEMPSAGHMKPCRLFSNKSRCKT